MSGGQPMPPVKFLLVDDLDENVLALSALLRRDEVELLTARTGSEALELLLQHDVALAFVDVQMPEMDGFELAELMRGSERTRNVPIIFVTAGNRDQHRLFRGYESGAVDFLYKPIEPHVLKSKADVFFQLYRQKQQLAQQLHERTETLRMNEMFMAVLGHDLRTPLSAVVTSAHVLQRGSTDEMVRKTAARLLASGQRMGRMIEDVLDLARVRLAGGMLLRREQADLGALSHEVVQEHRLCCAGRCIDVVQRGDLSGHWDGERLAQVVGNLVGNALQHGEGDVGLVFDGTAADAVTLTVSSTGRIPDEVLPRLFDPFRRGTQHAGRGEGLGLGLYIVQQIVEAHGGRVEVNPEDGADAARTVFRVRLPR